MIRADKVVQQVSSGQETLTILDQVDLDVAAGESLAIVGASGAGKSTLLGLLAAMNEDARARARAGRIGFVFQSFQLLPALTALENVLLPLELAGLSDARARARDALDQVGLSHRLTHRPRQLSGGEQQRVALARAFAPDPVVLFADEPTGNLDADNGRRIADLLFELNARSGTTLVMVTHDGALAARCQRSLLMRDGRLQVQAGA